MSSYLETHRLRLRQWQVTDLSGLRALCTDAKVMEFFPAPLQEREILAFYQRHQAAIGERGFGFWAVERKDCGEFIGFVGLNAPRFDAHFVPCLEIGWRLLPDAWGQGFATEAANACLQFGFDRLGADEIVSFTARVNKRSQAVMQRIGMQTSDANDFEHPLVAVGDRLRPHVLYRKRAPAL